MPHALVVGAGLGGIAAALRLRAQGYTVTVLERNAEAGGRAHQIQRGGYTFDAGPTVVTAPFLFAELFELFGQRLQDAVPLQPVSPWYRFMFEDGATFDYGGSDAEIERAIAAIHPPDVAGYQGLLAYSKQLYDRYFLDLASADFASLRTFWRLLPGLLWRGDYRSVYATTRHYLQHPHLRQAFSMHALLIGGNPYRTSAVYHLVHYLQYRFGVHYPRGGVSALIAALVTLMQTVGITLVCEQTVTQLCVKARRVCGVRLADGHFIAADVVVANADAPFVYQHLLPMNLWQRVIAQRWRYSMGVFLLYFGTRRRYPDVQQHTILFSGHYRAVLTDIFQRHRLPTALNLYLHRATASDPALAPAGCDAFYVLLPVPNLQAQLDWSVIGSELQQAIFEHLAATVLPDVTAYLDGTMSVTPADFASRYLSVHGAGFSIQPLLTQSVCFRFHNRAAIRNLYLVGAGTHPGAGMPGVLMSAKVVASCLPAQPEVGW